MPDTDNKYVLWQTMIDLASQYRETAHILSIKSYDQFKDKEINIDEYHAIQVKLQDILSLSIEIGHKVADLIDKDISEDLTGIEGVTKDLQDATERIKKIKDIANIAIEALAAIGTVVLACTTPNPATILAAVASTQQLAKDIITMTSAPATPPPVITATS